MCGRNTFLAFIISFIVGIITMAAFMLIGVIISLFVAGFIIVHSMVLGLTWVFEELWKLLYDRI